MARLRFTDDPMSRLAIWARRIAFFALVATILSIIVVRSGFLEFEPSLATFGGALVFAALAILLGLAAFVTIWIDGLSGLGHALLAIFIGLAILTYPAYLGYKLYKLPAIADITTDPIDPPRFEAIARVRPRNANPIIYAGLYAAEQQRRAYPDIEPLMVPVPPKPAFDAALAIATKRRWAVLDRREPGPGRPEGRIEAVARTPIMGFREDVVIRVRPTLDGARIDVRSASRYGRHDLGGNADRVRNLLSDIEDIAVPPAEKPEKKAQPGKGQKAQPAAKR
jgi:uncharacterized protein (DUF1499 family)